MLKSLKARGVEVSDADMPVVGRLLRLESLSLRGAPAISADGIHFLGRLARLRQIDLQLESLDDRGLEVLARLPNLEELYIEHSSITDDGLAVLVGHPSLRTLHVCGRSESRLCPISDAGIVQLAQIPRLEELGLVFTRVTPMGLKPLQEVKSLSTLILFGSVDDDYDAVAPLFPHCQVDAAQITAKPTDRNVDLLRRN